MSLRNGRSSGRDPPPSPSALTAGGAARGIDDNSLSTRLKNRGKRFGLSDAPFGSDSDSPTATKKSSSSSSLLSLSDAGMLNLSLAVFVSICIVASILHSLDGEKAASLSSKMKQHGTVRSKPNPTSHGEHFVIDERLGIDLFVDLTKSTSSDSSSTQTIASGPHSAILITNAKKKLPSGCTSSDLKFWLQYEGDAMGTVILTETSTGSSEWNGNFSFPITGSYQLVSYYSIGCATDSAVSDSTVTKSVLKEGLNVVINKDSMGAVSTPSSLSSDPYQTDVLYPKAAWLASSKVDKAVDSASIPYVWHDPSSPEATIVPANQISVSKQGAVFSSTAFFQFGRLSNYELVCWVGSESASRLHQAFLQERPSIAGGQRPFKFHYYNSTSFIHPVESWPDNEERRFRKCKHILVSMDEITVNPATGKSLTQQEYTDQVTTFVHHIEKAFQDETFPIWIFTDSESPTQPTSCTGPYILPRSSHHPCNDVLLDLFDHKKNPTQKFSSRVHLLDNTMIALPQSLLGSSNNSADRNNVDIISATIALRIFVFVGKKVAEWRDAGQHGQIDGLHRKKDGQDIIEPNFELVPYEGWK